jgi:hypothetical protein
MFVVWIVYVSLSANPPTSLIPLPGISNGRQAYIFAPTTIQRTSVFIFSVVERTNNCSWSSWHHTHFHRRLNSHYTNTDCMSKCRLRNLRQKATESLPDFVNLRLCIMQTGRVRYVKAVPQHTYGDAGWERKYSSYSFTKSALGGGEWSSLRPGRNLPRGSYDMNIRKNYFHAPTAFTKDKRTIGRKFQWGGRVGLSVIMNVAKKETTQPGPVNRLPFSDMGARQIPRLQCVACWLTIVHINSEDTVMEYTVRCLVGEMELPRENLY